MQSVNQQLHTLFQLVTQQKYPDVQLQLLQHHIKFHRDQLKSVRENEAKRF